MKILKVDQKWSRKDMFRCANRQGNNPCYPNDVYKVGIYLHPLVFTNVYSNKSNNDYTVTHLVYKCDLVDS